MCLKTYFYRLDSSFHIFLQPPTLSESPPSTATTTTDVDVAKPVADEVDKTVKKLEDLSVKSDVDELSRPTVSDNEKFLESVEALETQIDILSEPVHAEAAAANQIHSVTTNDSIDTTSQEATPTKSGSTPTNDSNVYEPISPTPLPADIADDDLGDGEWPQVLFLQLSVWFVPGTRVLLAVRLRIWSVFCPKLFRLCCKASNTSFL